MRALPLLPSLEDQSPIALEVPKAASLFSAPFCSPFLVSYSSDQMNKFNYYQNRFIVATAEPSSLVSLLPSPKLKILTFFLRFCFQNATNPQKTINLMAQSQLFGSTDYYFKKSNF